MTITYIDYLAQASNEQIMATKAITQPRTLTSPEDVVFKYSIAVDEERLNEQAKIFRQVFTSRTDYIKSVNQYLNVPYAERDQVIEDTYKYSFIKIICIIKQFVDSGYNYFGNIPTHSYGFIGHKLLLYIFMLHNSYTPSRSQQFNVSITKILNLDEKRFNIIKDMSVYKESIQEAYPGGIFNPRFERVLESMISVSDIHISDLSNKDDLSLDGKYNPLGNMAINSKLRPLFSTMEDSFATIRSAESVTDTDSKFWNTANFIHIDHIDLRFTNANAGSPYTYVAKSLESPEVRFAEIKAITGIEIDYLYSDFGYSVPDFGRNLGTPSPLGSPSDPTDNGNPTNRRFNSNFNNNNNNGNQNVGNNNNQFKSNQNRIQDNKGKRAIVSATKQFANTVGRSLTTNEASAFIGSIAQQYVGHRLKRGEINRLANQLKNTKFTSENKQVNSNLGVVSGSSNKKNYYIEDIE